MEFQVFLQGADLFPHILSLVSIEEEGHIPGFCTVTTKNSSHHTWRNIEVQNGLVPISWVKPILRSKHLFPFLGISEFHSIIPANMNGQLIQNNEDRCIFWENLETIYIENIVNGNPQTLLDRLNYGGRLVNQLPLNQNPDDWLFVVYPRSGGIMRAARSNPKILDYTVNYFLCANEVEASYLVGLLNTPALGQLIMYREFLEILFLVELVPRFDPNNNLHQELAELNLQAETTAIELIHDIMYELEDGQPLPDHRILSNLIWRNLFENGIANQLNEVVAQLLPDQIR